MTRQCNREMMMTTTKISLTSMVLLMPLLLLLGRLGTGSTTTEAFTVGFSNPNRVGLGLGQQQQQESMSRSSEVLLFGARDAYFQLEEREDADVCVTEVFLKSDGSVDVLESDGPPCASATGTWTQQVSSTNPEFGRSHTRGSLEMTLKRSYSAGYSKRKASDMGKFGYDVVRTYKGDFAPVGDKLGVSGKIFLPGGESDTGRQGQEAEVGFFEMIDTTAARVGDHCSGPDSSQLPQQGKVRITPMGP
mmetsp:Transcript_37232/g.90350  ORF Transcript_37232/g.90350 Transcript_37232/m.90350 type:complete len:248 (-) Transcript_37232:184-927(-)|eukprot:CAMPEP_0113462310 /NCGR_PEP_ID=MMETSP0014_2-20120614/12016_1 /TAXON_ID=2857 /ORGANISM="Nitzschia sp." /LENGTH=247 /DNA_ID=CAMNT_0000354149 /DNA_START=54 /DNA_END=797 /DNA_ORIENTATION=- /assembly_acc=CAM_ASM_000159